MEPSTVLIAYGVLGPQPLPPREAGLASHPSRLDIVARILLAFMYTVGVSADRLLVAVLDGGDTGLTALFDHKCLPPAASHPEAYRIVYSTFAGRGPCRVIEAGFEETVKSFTQGYSLVMLVEDGLPYTRVRSLLGDRVAYIIGTAVDPPKTLAIPYVEVSVGPQSYHADHVAAYIALMEALKARGVS